MSDTNDKTWIQQGEEALISRTMEGFDKTFHSEYTPPTGEDVKRILDEMKNAQIYVRNSGMDSLSDLMNAPAEELLEVAIANYKGKDMSVDFLVRLGFSLAQEGGWEHIAPAWLRAHRSKSEDTMVFKSEYLKPEKP